LRDFAAAQAQAPPWPPQLLQPRAPQRPRAHLLQLGLLPVPLLQLPSLPVEATVPLHRLQPRPPQWLVGRLRSLPPPPVPWLLLLLLLGLLHLLLPQQQHPPVLEFAHAHLPARPLRPIP
jgi:hypothetical protein